MLKGIDARVTPELMDVLIRAGHGDEIALVDLNYPARSLAPRWPGVVELAGLDAPAALAVILPLLPLDGFPGTLALVHMQRDGAGELPDPVHRAALDAAAPHLPTGARTGSLPRPAFYDRAARAFAVIRCAETRPYGCFILRTGVVF
ncbi:MAG: ribose ABC transporter [Paracoccaceae bacterium]|nr:MAG: ribose ABC transporter [Paracoccaceae bacterium]